jgi:charged multivesicular body protein 2A
MIYLLFKATRVARRFEKEGMGNLWGTPKTAAQMLEECELDIGVGIRQMKRAREDFDDECKSLRDYAKAALQEGRVDECKIHVKHMLRYRGACLRMTQMEAKMQEMRINMRLMRSTQQMQQAMLNMTRAMVRMNRGINVKSMQDIIRNFEKHTDMMNDKQNMIDETLDQSMADFDNEQEESDIVRQVMEEIGLEVQMPNGTGGKVNEKELYDRLEKLKK